MKGFEREYKIQKRNRILKSKIFDYIIDNAYIMIYIISVRYLIIYLLINSLSLLCRGCDSRHSLFFIASFFCTLELGI